MSKDTKLQGSMLYQSGAAHHVPRSAAMDGKTPDAQTTAPKTNKSLKSKATER